MFFAEICFIWAEAEGERVGGGGDGGKEEERLGVFIKPLSLRDEARG